MHEKDKLQSRRVPWLGLFGRQLVRDIALHVLLAVLAGLALFIAIDFVETGNVANAKADATDLLRLQAFSLPLVVQQIAGLCVLIGSTTAVAALLRRGEVVAMFAAGAPSTILLKPALIIGLLFAVLYAGLTEWIAPPARGKVNALRRSLGLSVGDSDLLRRGNAWFRGRDRIYRVEGLEDPNGGALSGILMLRIKDGKLRDRWDVERLRYENAQWVGQGVVHRTFGPETELETRRLEQTPITLGESPADFVRSIGAPNRLPYVQLAAATSARERMGQSSILHRLELYRRHAFPLMLLIAVTLSVAVALRIGRRPSLATALAVGGGLGFSMWLLEEISYAFGSTASLPTGVAAHLGLGVIASGSILAWSLQSRPPRR